MMGGIPVPNLDDSIPTLSLAVPFYNEAGGVSGFFERVEPILADLGVTYEVVAVNDGSSDSTLEELLAEKERNDSIRVVNLTRNFGKEAALTAALDHCIGQAVIPIDGDLQDPPELIGDLLAKWREGYPVVIAKRRRRDGEGFIKRTTAHGFYRFFNKLSEISIPEDVGDFRLMDRKVIDAMKLLGEGNRFNKGLFAWVGYRTATIDFDREGRRVGHSKWNYWKLWNFALDGIFSFSSVPLRIWTYLGAMIATASFSYALFILIRTLVYGRDAEAPGYASLMVVILFLGGIQLISLGVMGEYIGRIFRETKGRPLYIAVDPEE
jgi:glycosyltransferase involved in cell wall biosynthesis|tara:strand:- start:351 stop:1319 length:969 start_codon:yes stop_codon:yes gene_type:complete